MEYKSDLIWVTLLRTFNNVSASFFFVWWIFTVISSRLVYFLLKICFYVPVLHGKSRQISFEERHYDISLDIGGSWEGVKMWFICLLVCETEVPLTVFITVIIIQKRWAEHEENRSRKKKRKTKNSMTINIQKFMLRLNDVFSERMKKISTFTSAWINSKMWC